MFSLVGLFQMPPHVSIFILFYHFSLVFLYPAILKSFSWIIIKKEWHQFLFLTWLWLYSHTFNIHNFRIKYSHAIAWIKYHFLLFLFSSTIIRYLFLWVTWLFMSILEFNVNSSILSLEEAIVLSIHFIWNPPII